MLNARSIQLAVKASIEEKKNTYQTVCAIADYCNETVPSNNWEILRDGIITEYVSKLCPWLIEVYKYVEENNVKGIYFALDDDPGDDGLWCGRLVAMESKEYYGDEYNEWRESAEDIEGLSEPNNEGLVWVGNAINELVAVDDLVDYALPFAFSIPAIYEATMSLANDSKLALTHEVGIGVGYRWGDSVNLGLCGKTGF